jgi:hypothetical protein
MFYDPWKEHSDEALELVYFDKNQRSVLKFASDFAYYLCLHGPGLALREDYHDYAKPEIVGVLSVSSSPPKFLKKCHLIPLGSRFVIDRNNGLHIVNSQAYFDFNERVKVVDSKNARNIEFVVSRSLQ